MTTIDDQATIREEQFRNAALQNRKPDGPIPTGHCLYCNEAVQHGRRFCSGECREDWELEQVARERKHGRF